MIWLLWFACHEAPAPAAAAPSAAPPSTTAAVVARRPEGALTLPGELQPWQSVELRGRLPAFVTERKVDVGDHVSRGDVLLRLSAPERTAERLEVEAQLAADRLRLGRLERAAATDGAVAPAELDAERGLIAASEARLKALRDLEAELVVRAPFDGVVTARGVDVGALVGRAGDPPMVALADLAHLRVVVDVPEAVVGVAAPGLAVTFVVGGATHEGAVARTSGALDPRSRTLHVELDVDGAGLLPGRHVEVRWPLDQGAALLYVPTTAVVRTTEATWVWAVRDGLLARVDVKEMVREKAEVAVSGALAAGELVVARGSEDLVAGAAAP
jgi:membrane fusion protein (multidrug efflux system)